MIFYFTGTGNSKNVANRLIKKGERLVNIVDCLKNNEYKFELKNDEALGFIFPVYFYNVPKIVRDFIEKLEVKNTSYVYSIITCGGGIMQSGNVLYKELSKRNIKLNYVKELLMPDNAMIYYAIDSQDKNNELLKSSYQKLELIKKEIEDRKESKFKGTLISDLVGSMYNTSLSTKKFYVEKDKCVSCGLCEINCPVEAIKLINGKAIWMKKECIKCLACINKCPRQAIQYGKFTKKRYRYQNPNV